MPDDRADAPAGAERVTRAPRSPGRRSTPGGQSTAGGRSPASGGQVTDTEAVLASKPSDWYWLIEGHKQVFSRSEAKEKGVSFATIKRRYRAGRWQRIHRGVYARFTGTPSHEAKLWGIVARVGPGAMLSHETAAELHGINDGQASTVHVTVPRSRRPAQKTPIPGVEIHRSDQSAAEHAPDWKLPRTTVADTVLDVVSAAKTLDYAYSIVSRALWKKKTRPEDLQERLAARKRYGRRAWLSDAIADVSNGAHFPLERRYLREVERAHGLPVAHRQAKRQLENGSHYKDNLYDEYQVCVELDGAAFHENEQVFADKRRDNLNLATDDVRTFRFGFADVTSRPCECAAIVVAGLRRGGWTGTPHACPREECRAGRS